MHVIDANEIFWMTFYTYDRIMEVWGKRWSDAVALYIKLLKQTRIQETNQTYTLNSFLREWLGRGDDRLRYAKNTLKKLWLVDDVKLQDEKWKIIGHYVRVNYLIDEQRVRTSAFTYNLSTTGFYQEVDSATPGWTDTNALSTQYRNACVHKINTCQESEKSQTRSSVSRERWTDEDKAKFETFWKIYPHYESRSRKKDAKAHFLERDYDEMMFSAKMLKWKTIMHPDKAEFVKWCHLRVNNFEPMPEYAKKQRLRELYRRHMTAWGDMKTRMEEIVRDFPDADFSEFREELSKEKTEYAIWSLIHGK